MTMIGLDLGKFKSVACTFDLETRAATYATVPTDPDALRRMLARKPAEPRQMRVPVDTLQRRGEPALVGPDRIIVMMAECLVLVMMPAVMATRLRIAAKLGPTMPVRVAAIRMRMAQLEPGQAAEDDQAGEQDMKGVETRSGHDGIRRSTRRK